MKRRYIAVIGSISTKPNILNEKVQTKALLLKIDLEGLPIQNKNKL